MTTPQIHSSRSRRIKACRATAGWILIAFGISPLAQLTAASIPTFAATSGGSISDHADRKNSTSSAGVAGLDAIALYGAALATTGVLFDPPNIMQSPQNTTVLIGTPANLSVQAVGSPPLSFQWFRNDEPIPDATFTNLSFTSVGLMQEGNYRVRVTNPGGLAFSEPARLSVFRDFGDAPGFPTLRSENGARHVLVPGNRLGDFVDPEPDGLPHAQALGDDLSDEDDEDGVTWQSSLWPGINTSCIVRAAVPGFLNAWADFDQDGDWNENGDVLFQALSLQPGQNSFQLTIPFFTKPGEVMARFRFSSVANLPPVGDAPDGEVEDCRLRIISPSPAIVAQPDPVTVAAGKAFVLNVNAEGAAPLKYQWKRNGHNIPGAIQAVLATPSAHPSDAGFYSVRVSNAAGTVVSKAVPVKILHPPLISNQPASTNVMEGEPFVLTALAFGTPPLAYQWYQDGQPLPGSSSAALEVSAAQLFQSGSYQAVVANDVGAVTSAVAVVSVLVPPVIVSQPVSTNVMLGDHAVFQVAAVGSPPLRYRWRLNGVVLPDATNATLIISPVTVGSFGKYEVLVANELAAVASQKAFLLPAFEAVNGADDFADRVPLFGDDGTVSGSNNQATAELGDPRIAGKPGGASVWYSWTPTHSGIATMRTLGSAFDTLLAVLTNSPLSQAKVIAEDDDRGSFHTDLVEFNVVAGQSYAIVIDGLGGQTGRYILQRNLEVTSERLAVIETHPQRQTVPERSDVTFQVVAVGDALVYQWRFNGQPIPGATGSTLTLTNVQRADVGRYRVWVQNGLSRPVRSRPATLELGPNPDVYSVDKLAERRAAAGLPIAPSAAKFGSSVLGNLAGSGAGGSSGFVSVSAGTPLTFSFSGVGTSTEDDVNGCCGRIPILYISSDASDFTVNTNFAPNQDGVLVFALLTQPEGAVLHVLDIDSNCLACSANGLAQIEAKANTAYYPTINLLYPPTEAIVLEVRFDLPISNAIPAMDSVVVAGGDLTLSAAAVSAYDGTSLTNVSYQWCLDGKPMEGQTEPALVLTHVTVDHEGTYSVLLSNLVSVVQSTVSVVTVEESPQLTLEWVETEIGSSVLISAGPASEAVDLQSSDDFETWESLSVIGSDDGADYFIQYEDTAPTNFPTRFFRLMSSPDSAK